MCVCGVQLWLPLVLVPAAGLLMTVTCPWSSTIFTAAGHFYSPSPAHSLTERYRRVLCFLKWLVYMVAAVNRDLQLGVMLCLLTLTSMTFSLQTAIRATESRTEGRCL